MVKTLEENHNSAYVKGYYYGHGENLGLEMSCCEGENTRPPWWQVAYFVGAAILGGIVFIYWGVVEAIGLESDPRFYYPRIGLLSLVMISIILGVIEFFGGHFHPRVRNTARLVSIFVFGFDMGGAFVFAGSLLPVT